VFEYIRGKLAASAPQKAIVDVSGVGYKISIGLSTYARLPALGSEVIFHVAYVVREDAHLLFGFLSTTERELFDQLTQVSGVGPKTGLALLGHLEAADLRTAILSANASLLAKVPGVGKKMSERLIMELRDKVGEAPQALAQGGKGVAGDAISALVNLGYHPSAAQKAVAKILDGVSKEPALGSLISQALRSI